MVSEEDSNKTVMIQSDWAEAIITSVQMYYTPTLVGLGSSGNFLSVYIFFRTKMRRASSSWYLSALAISDTFFLLSIFIAWLNMVGLEIFNLPVWCQFFVYLPTLCSFLSVWFVVSFTVERFVAVRYPLKRQSMCTVSRAKMIITILSLTGLIICSPVLWFSSPQKMEGKQNSTICVLAEDWKTWASVFNVADTFLTFVLPFSIIVILNGLIVKSVWSLERVRRTLTTNGRRNSRNSNEPTSSRRRKALTGNCGVSQTKVTKMLLIVSSVFLCFNLPAYVMRVRAFLEDQNKDPPRATVITQHICNIFFDTNFGINFVLYCASGQNFRRAVFRILLRRPRRLHSAMPISNHDFRRSSSMGRQRTVVYEVPWSDGNEMKDFTNFNGSKKHKIIQQISQEN